MDKASLLNRCQTLLAKLTVDMESSEMATNLTNGAISLISAVHGPASAQLQTFQKQIETISTRPIYYTTNISDQILAARGAIRNLQEEIEAGFTGSLRQQAMGEVLTDFIALARSVLDGGDEKATHVAAVLAAAAFEDTIRRMGESFANVTERIDLQDVLGELKNKGVLRGPQVGIAQSYLNFRNHALHANWEHIERPAIHSVLGFTEQLLLQHFGER